MRVDISNFYYMVGLCDIVTVKVTPVYLTYFMTTHQMAVVVVVVVEMNII